MLRVLTAAALGIYAGAMLTEAFILVPHWRSLPAAEFLTWYAANDRRLFGYFGGVTIATFILTVATGVASWRRSDRSRALDALAAVLMIVALVMFPAYFAAVNASFAAATIPVVDVPGVLRRWAMLHDVRTVLACVALAASLVALGRER